MFRREDWAYVSVWILFLILLLLSAGDTVKIKELRVPEVTRHGASVVLDCDYTLDDSTDREGLVVKWYLNDELRPVYQWIPGEMKPQGLGVLRNKLNLAYKASGDESTMHRALHILKPSAELSGEYTCVVSTFHNEDRKSKKMIVFVPERNLRVRQSRNERGLWSITCSADGVFPRPEIIIRMSYDNVSKELDTTNVSIRRNEDTGLYDIASIATLSEDRRQGMPVEFACELKMPEVNYTVRREAVFYPAESSATTLRITWIFFTCMLQILILKEKYS